MSAREIAVRGDGIRLGQLLQLADVVGSGGEAKALLGTRTVTVNGEVEDRRGRQLRDGDEVVAEGAVLRVRAAG
ncbi:RNA-binding S4 domain-containing protein [Patulibacter brassicae]|jgi:ribosome-associated protein|uniref:RNA-binding S4 domain-containing protein n=1 Tax=Patulibacter brassicae TaxID=1705717 RepID=A0ABU4VE18_9ACTN|nr:RNA-binding S4 domain-containing protein [Patulibacter brassicae]MDX8150038.1 RNA-binding S4 domain-containing protein [Patulibacter brassicae]